MNVRVRQHTESLTSISSPLVRGKEVLTIATRKLPRYCTLDRIGFIVKYVAAMQSSWCVDWIDPRVQMFREGSVYSSVICVESIFCKKVKFVFPSMSLSLDLLLSFSKSESSALNPPAMGFTTLWLLDMAAADSGFTLTRLPYPLASTGFTPSRRTASKSGVKPSLDTPFLAYGLNSGFSSMPIKSESPLLWLKVNNNRAYFLTYLLEPPRWSSVAL